ncbi:exodeoxyribonuclease VII large subunit [Candidatus Uhrbacteria bacterium CG_4_9_14_3_um_filter_50_9]|uniref:Exodeoxyribonuclease 7 large subunit n=1 Tax=Candidatus Uhrbacteria bacterium CG_4_9_14_3_um_filter_50_9 TaxID=1975035 RepID=A0A2M7XC68_9BACT|nr:MAG: exodeoxyribonuclease VII large subunit [Candidatus Uhrbacteria bacterium CG_4_9_14_3_um_filter_50_9]
MDSNVYSVSGYLDLVNDTLQMIPSSEVVIEGEVSDFRIAQQKWISFDLKDEKEQAVLKCFMTVWQLKVEVADGMRVQVKGQPKIYERFGTFKMNVQELSPVGEGALRQAYELLKKKLQGEGLFDASRKRSLERFPERIGLITSRDAAAFGDFVRILNNRWGGLVVHHAHVHVQGRQAVQEITGAFGYFNTLPEEERPDVLVLTRGGGGLEDLHAFNDESVARAIYASQIPVVVGVGHERDESLADFVADVRASTPSNAAERVVPSRTDVLYELQTMTRHMEERLQDRVNGYGQVIEKVTHLVSFVLERQKERFRSGYERLLVSSHDWLPQIRTDLENLGRVLRQVDPQRVLARGYSIVTTGGVVVKDAGSLDVGQEITVQFAAGSAEAEIKRKNGHGQQKLV